MPVPLNRDEGLSAARSFAGHGMPCPTVGKKCADCARLLFLCGGGGGGFVCVLLLEALDATGRIYQLLLAGEERMALGADFHADHSPLKVERVWKRCRRRSGP